MAIDLLDEKELMRKIDEMPLEVLIEQYHGWLKKYNEEYDYLEKLGLDSLENWDPYGGMLPDRMGVNMDVLGGKIDWKLVMNDYKVNAHDPRYERKDGVIAIDVNILESTILESVKLAFRAKEEGHHDCYKRTLGASYALMRSYIGQDPVRKEEVLIRPIVRRDEP